MRRGLAFPLLLAVAATALFHGIVLLATLAPHPEWSAGREYWTRPVWDEHWYCEIATEGYAVVRGSYRLYSSLPFSPGLPLALRGVHAATGVPVAIARCAVAAVSFAVALVLLWRVLWSFSADARRNRWALALFAFAPGSMYFLTGYSESLYLPLVALFFLLLLRGRHLGAAVACALALFVRSPAVVLAATLCVAVLADALRAHPPRRALLLAARRLALYLPVCSLGALGYMLMLWIEVGDPLAFVKAYSAWYPLAQTGLQAFVLDGPAWAVRVGLEAGIPSMVTAGVFVALMPVVVFVHRRSQPLALVAFSAIAWCFFLQQSPPIKAYEDMLRWLAPVFPFPFCLALGLERARGLRAPLSWALLAGFAVLWGVNVYRFIHQKWVS